MTLYGVLSKSQAKVCLLYENSIPTRFLSAQQTAFCLYENRREALENARKLPNLPDGYTCFQVSFSHAGLLHFATTAGDTGRSKNVLSNDYWKPHQQGSGIWYFMGHLPFLFQAQANECLLKVEMLDSYEIEYQNVLSYPDLGTQTGSCSTYCSVVGQSVKENLVLYLAVHSNDAKLFTQSTVLPASLQQSNYWGLRESVEEAYRRAGSCDKAFDRQQYVLFTLTFTRKGFAMYALGRTSEGFPILHKVQYSEDQDWGARHFHDDIPGQATCPGGELALSVSFPS